jgi:hypothetical protein
VLLGRVRRCVLRITLSSSADVSPRPLPMLPNTISEGFLEVGGIRHEVIPLPFARMPCSSTRAISERV